MSREGISVMLRNAKSTPSTKNKVLVRDRQLLLKILMRLVAARPDDVRNPKPTKHFPGERKGALVVQGKATCSHSLLTQPRR